VSERESLQSVISRKCNLCYRKDSSEDGCMLYSLKHAGIELCLGPFKDQEDRLQKVREDFKRERKPKPDWGRIIRDAMLNRYARNKKLFDEGGK
jgi:hypothetical protein